MSSRGSMCSLESSGFRKSLKRFETTALPQTTEPRVGGRVERTSAARAPDLIASCLRPDRLPSRRMPLASCRPEPCRLPSRHFAVSLEAFWKHQMETGGEIVPPLFPLRRQFSLQICIFQPQGETAKSRPKGLHTRELGGSKPAVPITGEARQYAGLSRFERSSHNPRRRSCGCGDLSCRWTAEQESCSMIGDPIWAP